MATIRLEEVTRANWQATLRLAVAPQQQCFVADTVPIAAIVLAKAYIRPAGLRWIPYAIVAESTLVGMVALAYQPNSASEYWIYHLFIDARYQRRGYGQRALAAVVALLVEQHPACACVQLLVHPDNTAAQRMYARGSFERTTERIDGDMVFRRRLR